MQQVQEFLFYIVPLVTVIVLWKLLVTNRVTPPGNVTVLGLSANDSPSAPSSKER